MLSLLGSLLGFGTSFLPKVMDYFQDRQDKAHELAMQDKILEQQKAVGEIKLDSTKVDAAIREMEALLDSQSKLTKKASQWCVNLSSSVRPVVTYAFFVELAALTFAVFQDWITTEQYQMVWNHEMQAVWAAVVSFWFGSRQALKSR